MLIQEDTPEAQVFGCWRILDTTGPSHAEEHLPGASARQGSALLAASGNSAVSPSTLDRKARWAFSDCTLEAMRALARYSLQNDIQTLVTVTTVGWRR